MSSHHLKSPVSGVSDVKLLSIVGGGDINEVEQMIGAGEVESDPVGPWLGLTLNL